MDIIVPRRKASQTVNIDGVTLRRVAQHDDIYIRVPLPARSKRKSKWLRTGVHSMDEAARIAKEAGIPRLIALAQAGALSRAAISAAAGDSKRTCSAVLEEWRGEAVQAMAPATVAAYVAQVTQMLTRLKRTNSPISYVRRDSISIFVNDGTSGLATRRVKLAAVKAVWGFAAARGYVSPDPTTAMLIHRRQMTIEQLEPRPVFPFTEAEFRAVMVHPKITGFWWYAVGLSYWTALRFVDIVSLEWASLKDDALLVWTKKRGKRIWLPFEDELIGSEELRAIVTALLAEPRVDPTYCFPKQRGMYYGGKQSQFPNQFALILDTIGIHDKTFHSLRHAAISRWAAAGKTLEAIARLVGHSSVETTQGYVHDQTG